MRPTVWAICSSSSRRMPPEELLFVPEIVVDTLLIDLRPLGDTLHGRPIGSMCGKFGESRIFDLLFRTFGIPSHHL